MGFVRKSLLLKTVTYFKWFNMLVKSKWYLLHNMKCETSIFDVFNKTGVTSALMVANIFQK